MDSDAVPPSSPPHATTTNAPDSPFFEPRYNVFSPKSSSPPPLFSSDDSRESADLTNYESPRIFKNKRKGAWFNAESAHSTPEAKKTKMTRNYDSGVYMMSDSTDSSESLLLPHKSPFAFDGTIDDPAQRQYSEEEGLFLGRLYAGLDRNSQTYDFSNLNLQDSDIGRIGELASVIKNVPDPGNDLPSEGQYRSMVPELHIDLSSNRLRHLTPSLFRLQNLTTLTMVHNDIEELPAYIGQLHDLRELYISRNRIQWLPFEMLELFCGDNETRLSALGDSGIQWLKPKSQLEACPSHLLTTYSQVLWQISRIPRLDVDLAAIPHLQQLHRAFASDPNRDQLVWIMRQVERMGSATNTSQAWSTQCGLYEEGFFQHHPTTTSLEDARKQPKYLARTLVSYFDEAGSLVSGSPKPPSSNDDEYVVLTKTMRGVHGAPDSWFTPPHTKTTKSLLTMSIYSALRNKGQEDLTISDLRHHIGDPVPPVAEAILDQAERNSRGGFGEFRMCHICKSDYVVARAEWIEWWCTQFSAVKPFKVQVCSWGCVPDAMLRQPVKLMSWE
jgi:hypothetical protein